jgi:predicted esterase
MNETEFIYQFVPGTSSKVTLLLLHGTGGNEHSLLELGNELLPGASLLSPRGKVIENGAPRFFRRLAEGVFDEEDLHRRTAELAAFVRDSVRLYNLDETGIVAVGYSNGANIAASLLFTNPGLLTAAVLLRAMAPFEPKQPIALPGTPVLLLSGEEDPLIPHNKAERLATLLKGAGAALEHKTVRAGHALTEPELITVRNFLRKIKVRIDGL